MRDPSAVSALTRAVCSELIEALSCALSVVAVAMTVSMREPSALSAPVRAVCSEVTAALRVATSVTA
ncbi:hypothetical protein D9M70_644060 [compost metagenome]